MKLPLITFLTFFTLLFSKQLKAQNDYVINQKGDTIQCDISLPFITGMGSIKYKPVGDSKSIKIRADEIKEYRKGKNNPFRSIKYATDGKPSFLEVIENGQLALYRKIVNGSSSGINMVSSTATFWYINKIQRDTVSALKTDYWSMSKSRKDRKNEFGEMLKDDPELYNKYTADDRFTFDQLRYLIHQYNIDQAAKR